MYRADPETLIDTGAWPPEVWTRADFRRWFVGCLHNKINRLDGRRWLKLSSEYQSGLAHDAQIINDRKRGLRRSGCNLLNTPELKRRYPAIDNPEREE
jgi:hypothetical protein